MEVYGQLFAAGLERRTGNPTGADLFIGRMWFRTDTNKFHVYDGSSVLEFADLTSAQTFQQKTLAGATISDFLQFTQQGSTPSTPAAGSNRIYFKTNGTPYTLDSSGAELPLGSGGGGSKNYFEDTDAEIDSTVGNWLTDDGVGSPSAGLTLSITAVAGELLAGVNSLKLVKDAANRDGHFIKVLSKTIDPSDRGRPNYGSFEFRPGTGYVSSDLIFEVYDVTNAAVLYSGVAEDLELLNSRGRFNWVTYLEDTTAQVEFRLKVNNTNTNGFDAFFDEFKFGPAAQLIGYNSSDMIDDTAYANANVLPTGFGAGLGTFDYYETARRGEFLHIRFGYNLTANPGSGTSAFEFPLPYGLQVKFTASRFSMSGLTFNMDHNVAQDSGADQYMAASFYATSANTIRIVRMGTGSTIQGQHILANCQLYCDMMIPIEGWENGNLVNTNELSLQTVRVLAGDNAGTSLTANVTNIDFTEIEDSHGTWNGSEFTAPQTGHYSVEGMVTCTAASARILYLWRDSGSGYVLEYLVGYDGGDSAFLDRFSWKGKLNKGDKIAIRSNQNETLDATSPSAHWIRIYSIPDFTVLGAVRNDEYLETIYADSTGDINSASYVSPGPSEFDLPLTEGTWDVGYSVSVALESLGGTGRVDMAAALHLDGVLIPDTEGYVMSNGNATTDGNILIISNTTRITLTQPQDLQLKVAASPAASMRSRMVSVGWTANINGDDTAPKLWARRVK